MCSRSRLDRPARNRVIGASLAATAAPLILFRHHLHNTTSNAALGFLLGALLGVSIALMLGGRLCRLRGRM